MLHIHKLKDNESRTEDGKPVPLTPAGIERLQTQLASLKRALPRLAAEAERTAAFGDRSDNAEYKQAKGALRGTHRRIFEIENQLKRSVVIPSGAAADGKIRLGSIVTLLPISDLSVKSENAKKTGKTFEIVGPLETDPPRGRISHQSPFGAALIGHAKDDLVKIKTADGSAREYKIVEVN